MPTNSGLTRYSRGTYGNIAGSGPSSLTELSRSRLHRILTQGEIHPHKIRYYVERREPEFETKMAVVLHVYKEVEMVNAELMEGVLKEPAVVTISYDEKPGIQALATTTPDLPPAPHQFETIFGITNTSDWERSRCWPALISTQAVSQRSSATAMPAPTSSRCWENWTRVTRLKRAFASCWTTTQRTFQKRHKAG